MILQVLLVVALAGVAQGDGCCAPDQWEGYESGVGGFTSKTGRKGSNSFAFKISYDAESQQVAVRGGARINGEEEEKSDDVEQGRWRAGLKELAGRFRHGGRSLPKPEVERRRRGSAFKVIYNFPEKKGYYIKFMKDRKPRCISFELKKKFRKACIPDEAKLVGSSYFGAGKGRLDVNAYSMSFRGRRAEVEGVALVTKEGCVPVSEDWWGTYNRAGFFDNVNFFEITAGIANRTVFDAPSYCPEERVDSLDFENYSKLRQGFPSFINL